MDIILQLRKRADDFARERAIGPTAGAYDYMACDEQWDRQAADEIERLRAALKAATDLLCGANSGYICGSQPDCEWVSRKNSLLRAVAALGDEQTADGRK